MLLQRYLLALFKTIWFCRVRGLLNLSLLPLACVISGLCSVYFCYTYRSENWRPISTNESAQSRCFSDNGDNIPYKFIFIPGINFTAFLGIATQLAWYAVRLDLTRRVFQNGVSATENTIQNYSFASGLVRFIALLFVASFPHSRCPAVHTAGKLVFFILSVAHIWLSLIERLTDKSTRRFTCLLHFIVAVATTNLYLITLATEYANPDNDWIKRWPDPVKNNTELKRALCVIEYTTFAAIILHMLLMMVDMREYKLQMGKIFKKQN